MLGRIHLSGFLNRMTERQQALVAESVAAYKAIRADLPGTLPFWPLGLPGWEDDWLALGLRGAGAGYLTVWHRPGPDGGQESAPARQRTLSVPHLRGQGVRVQVVHPAAAPGAVHWDDENGELTVELPHAPQAVVVRLAVD
jgi:alpha-galactosidase